MKTTFFFFFTIYDVFHKFWAAPAGYDNAIQTQFVQNWTHHLPPHPEPLNWFFFWNMSFHSPLLSSPLWFWKPESHPHRLLLLHKSMNHCGFWLLLITRFPPSAWLQLLGCCLNSRQHYLCLRSFHHLLISQVSVSPPFILSSTLMSDGSF